MREAAGWFFIDIVTGDRSEWTYSTAEKRRQYARLESGTWWVDLGIRVVRMGQEVKGKVVSDRRNNRRGYRTD